MSWSLYISDKPAKDAYLEVQDMLNVPMDIRRYHMDGIDGLVKHYGAEVHVTIASHGHLCTGPDSYEVTSATIDVRRAEAKQVE